MISELLGVVKAVSHRWLGVTRDTADNLRCLNTCVVCWACFRSEESQRQASASSNELSGLNNDESYLCSCKVQFI